MTIPETIAMIRAARALLISAIDEVEIPQVQATLRNADMELHWALWNLGEPVGVRPESDYGVAAR